jgi:hypothetical protein
MIEISSAEFGECFFNWLSNPPGSSVSLRAVIFVNASQASVRFGRRRTASPLALGLLVVALLNECKAQLIVAHGIVRSAPEGGLQRG